MYKTESIFIFRCFDKFNRRSYPQTLEIRMGMRRSRVYSVYSAVLGQRRRWLTGIEPAMGCSAGPTLNQNLVGRPTSSVSGQELYGQELYKVLNQVHCRQVFNECWPTPVMVVEVIHLKDI